MQSSPCTVLIIDDDKDFCLLLSSVFDAKKFETISVHTLEEASQQLSSCVPAVVLLDNKLPDGHGLDFIKSIHNADPRIGIIMISGHTSPEMVSKALQRGVNRFISKPCSFKVIMDAVEEIM